ncbi:MAG: A/G-specific adenine glycosylase [Bacteroidota bacterium]|nr:A/G-specific adenine glycosylase [Bacteroidota bacterium]
MKRFLQRNPGRSGQSLVLHWYKHHRRSLPWRATHNPYRILISEIMAQQTQISRVVDFYSAWLKRFPSFKALASASRADVLRQWSGLGYNNRAVRLHQLAKEITSKYHGTLPRTIDELLTLPGIGKYTAHAVACFAFGQSVPVVDVNIYRVVSRMLFRPKKGGKGNVRSASNVKSEKEIWNAATSLLPKKKASEWNQALMDLGSQICTARNPKCGECPLQTQCASAFSRTFHAPSKNSGLRTGTSATKRVIFNGEKKRKIEPHHNGVPRRILRGRILKLLHSGPKRFNDILPMLGENRRASKRSTHSSKKFLCDVLTLMKNDGVIEMRGNGTAARISLPEQ